VVTILAMAIALACGAALTTTAVAYARIKQHDVVAHREWMIRS
jgi:uncharacterized membrane protein YozB (DUF420 family)